MISHKTTIIWDWNGTLVNDLSVCVQIINKMLEVRNLNQITIDDYQSIFTFPVKAYYLSLGFDFHKEDYRAVAKEYIDQYNQLWHCCTLQPQVQETLTKLKQKGYSQAILSAMEEQNLKQMVSHFKLDDFFQAIIGIENNLAESKVSQGKRLLTILKKHPKDICMIGDTLHDAEVAKHIGCECILISHGHHSHEKLKTTGLPVIKHLRELIDF